MEWYKKTLISSLKSQWNTTAHGPSQMQGVTKLTEKKGEIKDSSKNGDQFLC